MSCLNDIVSLGICPEDEVTLSGLRLIDAPGMNITTFAKAATETYIKGLTMVEAKKQLAITQLRNDFIGALQANKVVTTISQPVYDVSYFNPAVSAGTYAGERGLIFNKIPFRGALRTTYFKSIELYPLASGDGVISIYYELDGNVIASQWDVEFVANELNVFDSTNLAGFPFALPAYANVVKILVDQTDIDFATAAITCLKGCGGQLPNECGWAEGWDGTRRVKSEGYGVNVKFQCKCDYEKILCDLAPSFSGELLWLKWQIAIAEEIYRSNRFNEMVVYGHDELDKVIIPDLENKYTAKWNALMAGLFAILQTYKDGCLDCRGIKWVTAI